MVGPNKQILPIFNHFEPHIFFWEKQGEVR